MTWLYLMKERNKVFPKFLLFVNEMQTQFSATFQTFRSDNALEYTSSQFKTYCDNHVYTVHNKMGSLNASIGTFLRLQGVS